MKRSTLYTLLLLGIVLLPLLLERTNAAGQLSITVHTDKATYAPGELVIIQGQVSDDSSMSVAFADVSVQANDPQGKPVHMVLLLSSADGSFADQFTVPPDSVSGGYTIYVTASKPGYADGYGQAACVVVPELTRSHTPLLALLLLAVALLSTKRMRMKSCQVALHKGRAPTDNRLAETATSISRTEYSPKKEPDVKESEADLREFEERLQKAIEESLALFRPVSKHNFCMTLKEAFDYELKKMAGDPERLSSVLDQILGSTGRVIGRAIAHRVAATYSIQLRQDPDLTYADHIRRLRQLVRSRSLQTSGDATSAKP